MAVATDGRRLHAECRLSGLQDGVRGVAIGANRRGHFAGGDRFAVNAGFVVVGNLGVATSACFWNIGLERGARRINMAQNLVRPVAALAVGSNQQTLFAQREAMDGVNVIWIDAGKSVFTGHTVVAVTLAAGFGHVERVDSRTRIGLGEYFVRVAVAAGAGMLLAVGVHAGLELIGLVGVAGFAVDRGNLVRMRVTGDIGVTGITSQRAVNTGVEFLTVHADAVSLCILQRRVGVACQAIRLCTTGQPTH